MLVARMKTASFAPATRAYLQAHERDTPPLPDEVPHRRIPMKRDWLWWSLAVGFSGMGMSLLALVLMARHLS